MPSSWSKASASRAARASRPSASMAAPTSSRALRRRSVRQLRIFPSTMRRARPRPPVSLRDRLPPAKLDVLRHMPGRPAAQPSPIREPQHRYTPTEQLVQRLRRYLHAPENAQLGHVDEPEGCDPVSVLAHLEPSAADSDE